MERRAMTQPTEYVRRYRFTDWEANNPGKPQPGTQLDAEFDDIQSVLQHRLAAMDAALEDLDRLRERVLRLEDQS
jgi:hypothetical protein